MTANETICQSMNPLTADEIDDAMFRGRDRAWVAVAGMFDHKHQSQKLTYKALGDRINRLKSQVHYWLSGPQNITLKTLGLLAEGMDTDLEIRLVPREVVLAGKNYCHPSEGASSDMVVIKTVSDSLVHDDHIFPSYTMMSFNVEPEDVV